MAPCRRSRPSERAGLRPALSSSIGPMRPPSPEHLTVREELSRDAPPEMYEREATWCWKNGSFKWTPEEPGEVSIERRHDGQRAPIYVVMPGGTPVGWSYSRAWALLDAAEKAGRPPFMLDGSGVLRTMANSPLHLPLPRPACARWSVPGRPVRRIEERGGLPGRHRGTRHPFGQEARSPAVRAVPGSWTRKEGGVMHNSIGNFERIR